MLFFAYFNVSQKRNIKRSTNGMKPLGELVLELKQSRRLGVYVREATRKARGRGARPPPWARPPPSWAPRGSTDLLLPHIYIYLRTLKTSREPPKHNFHRRNFLYPRDPILETLSVLHRRGNPPRRASTSTPRPLR